MVHLLYSVSDGGITRPTGSIDELPDYNDLLEKVKVIRNNDNRLYNHFEVKAEEEVLEGEDVALTKDEQEIDLKNNNCVIGEKELDGEREEEDFDDDLEDGDLEDDDLEDEGDIDAEDDGFDDDWDIV